MRSIIAIFAGVALLMLPPGSVIAQDAQDKNAQLKPRARYKPYPRRPKREEKQLRYENISDIEIRQIQNATRDVLPGAIINISGVTTGCPCEDGPKCTDQVWLVAYNSDRTLGLQLSKIDGQWIVGPVQAWWLERARVDQKFAQTRSKTGRFGSKERIEYYAALQILLERYPTCPATSD